jgi:hypothetical protein
MAVRLCHSWSGSDSQTQESVKKENGFLNMFQKLIALTILLFGLPTLALAASMSYRIDAFGNVLESSPGTRITVEMAFKGDTGLEQ